MKIFVVEKTLSVHQLKPGTTDNWVSSATRPVDDQQRHEDRHERNGHQEWRPVHERQEQRSRARR